MGKSAKDRVVIINDFDLLSKDEIVFAREMCIALIDENRHIDSLDESPTSRYVNNTIQKELEIEGMAGFINEKPMYHFGIYNGSNMLSSFTVQGDDMHNRALVGACIKQMYKNIGHYKDENKDLLGIVYARGVNVNAIKEELNLLPKKELESDLVDR